MRSAIRSLAAVPLALLLVAAVGLAAARPGHAVEVRTVESPGGITALLVEDHTNPIIALHLAFRGGSALDPDGMAGLASLVSSTIDEGAGELDSKAFQGRLEDLSIRLRFSADRDTFGGTLETLTENADEAFRLLRLALTEPRFDDEPVARIRSQILSGLRQEAEEPNAVAGKRLYRALFGDHPYARPTDGTPETVPAITVEAMRAFVNERFARDNLVVGVTGDITADALARRLDETFGGLPAQAAPWNVADVAPRTDGRTIVVDKAVPQSAIVFAQRGLPRADPDFYAAYVMNHVLGGGGFTSRLYGEVREKRGLAYSVYSYLVPYEHAALLAGGAGTANARVADTLAVIRDQWAHMAEKGVTADELEDARTYLTGSYPLRFSSSGSIASMLVGIQLDDLGADYFDRRNDYIEAVTLDDVNRVAGELLDPDSLVFAVVGQPAGLAPTD